MFPERLSKLAREHGLDLTGAAVVVKGNVSHWTEEARDSLWSAPPESALCFRFDAYPGAHRRQLLRDIASVHCTNPDAPDCQEQFMEFLRFLANESPDNHYGWLIGEERRRLEGIGPDAFKREIWGPWRPFRLEEIEGLAHSAGSSCALPRDPGFEIEQWAILHRRRGAAVFVPARTDNGFYHEFAYPDAVHLRTLPEGIASIAYAFGVDPPPVRGCRVLELGCGSGLTLRTLACLYPETEFVGMDFAENAIEEAKRDVAALGLRNIRFEAADLAVFDPGAEPYEFILAHGLLSWVPDAIRRRVYEIVGTSLAHNGLAFLSFNVLPGYRGKAMLRDAGLWAARDEANAEDRSAKALAYVLAADNSADPYLRGYVESLRGRIPSILKFDEFADVDRPLRFAEFEQAIRAQGLRYVADSPIEQWTSCYFPGPARSLLRRCEGDPRGPGLRMRYHDVICNTTFHGAIVCRQQSGVSNSPVSPRILHMQASTAAQPLVLPSRFREPVPEVFVLPNERRYECSNPLLKAFLLVLRQRFPGRIGVQDAAGLALLLCGKVPAPEEDWSGLIPQVQELWETGVVNLHTEEAPWALTPGLHPRALAIARSRASAGGKVYSLSVNGLLLEPGGSAWRVLPVLDGTKNAEEIMRATGLSAMEVDEGLQHLAKMGLLI